MNNPEYLKVVNDPNLTAQALEASVHLPDPSSSSSNPIPPPTLPHWLAQPYLRPPLLPVDEASREKDRQGMKDVRKLEELERPIDTADLQAEDEKRNGRPEVMSGASSIASASTDDLTLESGKEALKMEVWNPRNLKNSKCVEDEMTDTDNEERAFIQRRCTLDPLQSFIHF